MKIDENDVLKIAIGLIFVIFLIIIARGNDKVKVNDNKDNNKNNSQIKEEVKEEKENIYSKIDKGNYSFIYNININDKNENIIGSVNNNILNIDNLYNGDMKDFNNIKDYFKYLNIESIKEVLDLSYCDNKDNVYTCSIDTFDLIDIYNSDIEYDSFNNSTSNIIKLILIDNYISEISLDYTNYYKYLDKGNTKFNINIKYDYQ